MRGEFVAVLIDLADRAAGENSDSFLFNFGPHMDADVLVETAQNIFAAVDQRHVAAEACKDAGKFQRDITAALNQDALRQRLQVKHFVRRDHVLDAGNRGAMIWRATGGDQHILRFYSLAGAEPERMSVFEYRARFDDAGAGLFDIGG